MDGVRDFAGTLAVFRRELMDHGFTREAAEQMVVDFNYFQWQKEANRILVQ